MKRKKDFHMFLWFLVSVFNILILSRLYFSGFYSVVNGFLCVSEMFPGLLKIKTMLITTLKCYCFFSLMVEKELGREEARIESPPLHMCLFKMLCDKMENTSAIDRNTTVGKLLSNNF